MASAVGMQAAAVGRRCGGGALARAAQAGRHPRGSSLAAHAVGRQRGGAAMGLAGLGAPAGRGRRQGGVLASRGMRFLQAGAAGRRWRRRRCKNIQSGHYTEWGRGGGGGKPARLQQGPNQFNQWAATCCCTRPPARRRAPATWPRPSSLRLLPSHHVQEGGHAGQRPLHPGGLALQLGGEHLQAGRAGRGGGGG